jgi:hypothetical protein
MKRRGFGRAFFLLTRSKERCSSKSRPVWGRTWMKALERSFASPALGTPKPDGQPRWQRRRVLIGPHLWHGSSLSVGKPTQAPLSSTALQLNPAWHQSGDQDALLRHRARREGSLQPSKDAGSD